MMSKRESKELSTTPENETSGEAAIESPPTPQPAVRPQANVTVDDSKAVVCYANFCRVTGTPEELILDFGLNSNPIGNTGSIEIAQRLVMNYFTAKRLLQALAVSVQRHEAAFGVLETDIQKRVAPAARRQLPGSP